MDRSFIDEAMANEIKNFMRGISAKQKEIDKEWQQYKETGEHLISYVCKAFNGDSQKIGAFSCFLVSYTLQEMLGRLTKEGGYVAGSETAETDFFMHAHEVRDKSHQLAEMLTGGIMAHIVREKMGCAD